MGTLTSTETPRLVQYTVTTSSSGPFDIPFTFADSDEIKVYIDGIEITEFLVTQASEFSTEGNTVTLETAVSNKTVTIESAADSKRTSTDGLTTASINTEIDNIYANLQEIDLKLSRAITLPVQDPLNVSMTLAKKADRSNGFLSFDSNGNVEINALTNLTFLNLENLTIDKVYIDDFTIKINDDGNAAGDTTLRLSGYTINDYVEVYNSAFRVQPTSASGNVEIGYDGGAEIKIADTSPVLDIYDTSAQSPSSTSYLGEIKFSGKNSSGDTKNYASVYGYYNDPDSAAGGETGGIRFSVKTSSSTVPTTSVTQLRIEPTGISVTGDISVSGNVDGRDVATDGTKLDGIEAGAEVNDPAFKTISVSGQADVVADVDADTLTLIAGSNVTITTDASGDSITISSPDDVTFNQVTADILRIGDWTGGATYAAVSHSSMTGDEYMMINNDGSTYISASTDGDVYIRGGNNTAKSNCG